MKGVIVKCSIFFRFDNRDIVWILYWLWFLYFRELFWFTIINYHNKISERRDHEELLDH